MDRSIEPHSHVQKTEYWVCRRCQDEGARIAKKIEKAIKDGQRNITVNYMKYSYENTGLNFRWPGDDPLQDLTLVEESMISLISVVTTVQQITGMCAEKFAKFTEQMGISLSGTPLSS